MSHSLTPAEKQQKMLFGKVWDDASLAPSSIDISFYTKKCRFFLGDRWIEVGPVKLASSRSQIMNMEVQMPDVGSFLLDRMELNDGTQDWVEWGPRVN